MEKNEITLEKIDIIRQRFAVGYAEAKEALEAANGDLIQALVALEEQQANKATWDEELQSKGEEVVAQLKTIIQKGNVTKLKLKKEDKILAEVPVNVGVLGLVGAMASAPLAILGAIGTVAAVVSKCSLEVEKPGDGEETEENPGSEQVDRDI